MNPRPIPTVADVRAARERIRDAAHRTPLLSSRLLGERAGGRVFLKAENLQRGGAFKFRGALNALRSLPAEARGRGVTTFSSGNHGQALALAARIEGRRAVIFMPEDAAAPKVEAARSYGAEVRFAGLTSAERQAAAERAAAEEGLIVVPPFDAGEVVAGQGTVALEVLEQFRASAAAASKAAPDVLLAPVGGGGLLAGIATVLAAEAPATRLFGVEPEAAPGLERALAAGAPVTIAPRPTIADGLKPVRVGDVPFAAIAGRIAGVLLVTDDELRAAVRFLLHRARLVVEPSGAAGVAALLAGRLPLAGATAVVVLSGGNVAPDELARASAP